MTNKQHITELDKQATGAIAECLACGQSDNLVLGFWKEVKMVVDELKTPQEAKQCMEESNGNVPVLRQG